MADEEDFGRPDRAADNPAWRLAPWQRPIYGLGVIIVVTALIGLSIASYEKVFTKVTLVNLETDHTGMQLLHQSDVKIRGIIVGDVRKISTYEVTGPSGSPETRARLQLALKPGMTSLIPRGVTALLLPKTLFGERYVALQIPENLSPEDSRPIRRGDTITEAQSSIELSEVLNDLYPVLLALHPEELKTTLTALATALQGRGKQLGENLVSLDSYLRKLNPKVPRLVEDIDKLGRVAMLYNEAAPDLLGALSNLDTTNRTIIKHSADLDAVLKTATSTANDANAFFRENGDSIIRLTSESLPVLALLDHYSPEYTCLLAAFTRFERFQEANFGGTVPGLHITMEVVKDQGKYIQGEQFKFPLDSRALQRVPHCYGLPSPLVPWPGLAYEATPYDGAVANATPSAMRSSYSGPVAGSAPENLVLGVLAADKFGYDPNRVPTVTKLLMAPLVRGATVSVG